MPKQIFQDFNSHASGDKPIVCDRELPDPSYTWKIMTIIIKYKDPKWKSVSNKAITIDIDEYLNFRLKQPQNWTFINLDVIFV